MVSIHPISPEIVNDDGDRLAVVVIPNLVFKMLMESYDENQESVYVSNVPIRTSEPVVNGRVEHKEPVNGN